MKDFKDKVAIITGAASGIGRGLAGHCAKEGMKVVLADIEEAPLKETEKALKAKSADVLAVRTDVSKLKDIEALAKKTRDAFGGVHLLFNNAGVWAGTTVWESTQADWEWTIGVNLWSVIHGIKVFVPIMLKQQTECHIVNTSSIGGLTIGPNGGPYRATKHGIVSISETLYLELKQLNARIGVSILCPGIVRSRVLEAERNRPSELQNPSDETASSPEYQVTIKSFQEGMMQNAMPAEECAEIVFQAIEQNRFYILTDTKYKEDIKTRMENILQDRNPEFPKHIP